MRAGVGVRVVVVAVVGGVGAGVGVGEVLVGDTCTIDHFQAREGLKCVKVNCVVSVEEGGTLTGGRGQVGGGVVEIVGVVGGRVVEIV